MASPALSFSATKPTERRLQSSLPMTSSSPSFPFTLTPNTFFSISSSRLLPLFTLLLCLTCLPMLASAQTTIKPLGGSGSGGGSSSSNSLGSALASVAGGSSSGTSSSSSSSSTGSQAAALGAASSFLYSMMGAAPTSGNPYPIRTMIGNMVWRLRQHKTPLMVIPPILRLMYQFRGPLLTSFNTAFKGLSASPGGAAAAAGLGAKAASDLAGGGGGPLSAAAGGFAGAAGAPGLMFPGAGMPGAFPFASGFQPAFFARRRRR